MLTTVIVNNANFVRRKLHIAKAQIKLGLLIHQWPDSWNAMLAKNSGKYDEMNAISFYFREFLHVINNMCL
jgi:hypothetical protein